MENRAFIDNMLSIKTILLYPFLADFPLPRLIGGICVYIHMYICIHVYLSIHTPTHVGKIVCVCVCNLTDT